MKVLVTGKNLIREWVASDSNKVLSNTETPIKSELFFDIDAHSRFMRELERHDSPKSNTRGGHVSENENDSTKDAALNTFLKMKATM